MMIQSRSLPQSWTFNGGEGAKMIHQPSYFPHTATVDYFLFQKGEVSAGNLSLSREAS
jgi:hypothetical protein